MAVNMDSFHTSFNRLDVNLRDMLFEIINGNKGKIISDIIEEINDKFNIREDYIEDFVSTHFIQPLEYSQNALADQISEKVQEVTNVIAHDDEKRSPSSRLAVHTNGLSRSYNGSNIERIKEDFMMELPSFLYRHGSTNFFDAELDEERVGEIRHEVNRYLNQVIDNYINQTKSAIKANTEEYCNSVQFVSKIELTPEDISNRMFVGLISDYRLKENENGLSFVNQITNEAIPATKVGDRHFKSYDGSMEFKYGDKTWQLTEGNKVTTMQNRGVSLGTIDNPSEIQVEYGFDSVSFIHNGKKTEDPELIKYMCEELKRKVPKIYEHQLAKNPDFKAAEEKANINVENSKDFIIDESGIAHINSANSSTLSSNLEAIGYRVSEREDGIYVTDSTGLEERATISGDFIKLSDGTQICANLYRFLDKGRVLGPDIYYKNPNKGVSAYISTDFKKISVFVGSDLYAIRVNNGVIEARSTVGGVKKTNVEDVKAKISEIFPNALSRLEALATGKTQEQEVPVMDNASAFITDEVPQVQEELDEQTKQAINEANEAAFKTEFGGEKTVLDASFLDDDISKENGLSDELAALAQEVEETPEQASYDPSAVEENSEVSMTEINDRLFELSQDPKVQEYINLLKKAEELKSLDSLGPIL